MSRRTSPRSCGGRIESLEPRRLFAVAGTLDPSFSGDGMATLAVLGITANDVAYQPNGKVVVVGTATIPNVAISDETKFAVARFNVDGTPDIAFGRNGIVLTQVSDEQISYAKQSFANAVAIGDESGATLRRQYRWPCCHRCRS